MAEIIKCYPRSETGKGAARRLRQKGFIPAVIYGHKMKTLPVFLSELEFTRIYRRLAGRQTMLELTVLAENEESRYQGFLQDIQQNPLSDRFLHLDFHRIQTTEAIRMAIPIELVGEAPGEKMGGIVDQLLREVEVEALPSDLPEKFTVDISSLQIGDAVSVAELVKDEKVKMLTPLNESVVTILAPKKVEETAPPEAAEEIIQPEVISEAQATERQKQKEENAA